MKTIILVVGARPNFVKIARLEKLLRKHYNLLIYHTGQHNSSSMSKYFIDFFDINVDITNCLSSNNNIKRFGQMLQQFDEYLFNAMLIYGDISAVMVVGDVDSTFVCAFAAKKMGLKVIHIESGLRSFDDNMPEEINRKLTDHISDIKFVTDPIGVHNLLKENCAKLGIDTFWVGNTMIDTLRWADRYYLKQHQHKDKYNIVVTLHRPENVDYYERRMQIVRFLTDKTLRKYSICICAHPRLISNFGEGLLDKLRLANINIIEQYGYLDFIDLLKHCDLIITDSGGVQEEATYYKKPTITLRKNTERPVTTYINDNLVVSDCKRAIQHIKMMLGNKLHNGDSYYLKNNHYNELSDFYYAYEYDLKKLHWHNNASQEIVNILLKIL